MLKQKIITNHSFWIQLTSSGHMPWTCEIKLLVQVRRNLCISSCIWTENLLLSHKSCYKQLDPGCITSTLSHWNATAALELQQITGDYKKLHISEANVNNHCFQYCLKPSLLISEQLGVSPGCKPSNTKASWRFKRQQCNWFHETMQ